jgi:methyltransferase
MTTIAVALLVFLPMLLEAVRAARNERAQRARGGLEAAGDIYWAMRVVYPASFAIMILEGTGRDRPITVVVVGVVVFAIAKLLKWWAILTLGQAWTFRVVVVPDMPLITDGPYRFIRHPNYIGVLGELVGVALMSDARVSGPILTVLFVLLMFKRIALEERTLMPDHSEGREARR